MLKVDSTYLMMAMLTGVIKLVQLVMLIKFVTLVWLGTSSMNAQARIVFVGIANLIVLGAQDLLNVWFVEMDTIWLELMNAPCAIVGVIVVIELILALHVKDLII